MNIQHLMLFALGPSVLSGCFGTKCDAGFDFQDEEQQVIAQDIYYTLERTGETVVADLKCEDICATVYGIEYRSELRIDSCSKNIDDAYFEQESNDSESANGDIDQTNVYVKKDLLFTIPRIDSLPANV